MRYGPGVSRHLAGAVLIFAIGAAPAAAAPATTALLMVAAGPQDTNRLGLILTHPPAPDTLLGFSCSIDGKAFGIALDFGAGTAWGVDGEDVQLAYGAKVETVRFSTYQGLLAYGGDKAAALFGEALAAKGIALSVPARALSADFDLAAASSEIARFRSLCPAFPGSGSAAPQLPSR